MLTEYTVLMLTDDSIISDLLNFKKFAQYYDVLEEFERLQIFTVTKATNSCKGSGISTHKTTISALLNDLSLYDVFKSIEDWEDKRGNIARIHVTHDCSESKYEKYMSNYKRKVEINVNEISNVNRTFNVNKLRNVKEFKSFDEQLIERFKRLETEGNITVELERFPKLNTEYERLKKEGKL